MRARASPYLCNMRKWCVNGVVDIIQTPETLEKSGGREKNEIRHRTFYIMENEDQLNAVWTQGSYECGISGDVTLDEMYQIINSIFEKD